MSRPERSWTSPQRILQRGDQAQRAEGGGPEVLDDAALEGDAAVERVRQMRQAGHQIGQGLLQLGLDAGRVELGGGEQRAQLVVQFARQVCALVFACGLQVPGQLGEVAGAPQHFRFEPVTLLHDLGLTLDTLPFQLAPLPHEQCQHHQTDERHGSHPDPAHPQRLVDALQAGRDAGVLVLHQSIDRDTDPVHQVTADARAHDVQGQV